MRPIFIYQYEPELIKKKDEFLELFQKDAANWEKIYLNNEEAQNDENHTMSRLGGGSVARHLNSISMKKSTIAPVGVTRAHSLS